MTRSEAWVAELVHEIAALDGVTVRAGISYGDLARLEERLGLHLPAPHRALLLETNGLELMHGYRRMLGYGPGAPIDLVWFNQPDTWKFAYRGWRDDLDDYLFLDVSADGGVTGCRRSDLTTPGNDPPHYTTHPLFPRPLGGDLPVSHWLQRGVRSMARNPRGDIEANRYLDHFGTLPADRLILRPPPALDEDGPLELAALLPVADALIAEADLFRQTRALQPGSRIIGMDTWVDDRGRSRLRYRVAP